MKQIGHRGYPFRCVLFRQRTIGMLYKREYGSSVRQSDKRAVARHRPLGYDGFRLRRSAICCCHSSQLEADLLEMPRCVVGRPGGAGVCSGPSTLLPPARPASRAGRVRPRPAPGPGWRFPAGARQTGQIAGFGRGNRRADQRPHAVDRQRPGESFAEPLGNAGQPDAVLVAQVVKAGQIGVGRFGRAIGERTLPQFGGQRPVVVALGFRGP